MLKIISLCLCGHNALSMEVAYVLSITTSFDDLE